MNKGKKKFSDEYIRLSLESSAPISNYFISGGLRHYCDINGQIMLVMDDDDDFNQLCIDYLKKQGAPEFKNVEDEVKHIKYLQSKVMKNP